MKPTTSPLLQRFVFAFLLAVFISPVDLEAQDKERYSDVREALQASGQLSGSQGPANVNWIDNGDRYSYMEVNQDTEEIEIRTYDPQTEEDEFIFSNSDHTFPDSDETFEFESFQWSADSKYLVFQSNFRPVYRHSGISDYYIYSVEDETLELMVEDARTAELSPDGSKIGYERDGDLFVFDLESEEETQLTDSGEENIYNGRFGWVYEEEFGLVQAWKWSPDSKYIAYWQTDESDVPLFRSTDYEGQHPEYVEIPYPKVGDENPQVKIGVIDVGQNEQEWMDMDIGDGYIPRLYWTSREGELGIVHLNRPQNKLSLFFHDVNSGDGELIMEETSDTWIDVFDFFAGVDHLFFFPDDREEFFWISDRDGWSHLYRYNYEGELQNQVTDGEWEVTNVHAIDSENEQVFFTSTEESPLERHLYKIGFDSGKKEQLTRERGEHDISMGSNSRFYIDRYSNTETPTQVALWNTDGDELKTLEENEEVQEYIEQHVYAPQELLTVETKDGKEYDASIIKPIDFDEEESYPLLLNIYGGPGAQGVYDSFETGGWTQYLAQEGYVIVNINNRGSGGYGSEFEKQVYQRLGELEAEDFADVANTLAEESWIDGDRMAIRGHSYGGYISALTLLLHPNVFEVGIVGAPVTDWRLYDTIYTERYMGLLEENEEGYRQSSAVTHAANLEDHLFIAHSAMDENVHMQNTMQLITALTNEGKDADLRIYPPGAHGVAYNQPSSFLLFETYTNYLNRYLKEQEEETMMEVGQH